MEQEILKLILVEVREIKGDLANVKEDLSKIKADLVNVKEELSKVKTDLANVKELAEFNKETGEAIMNVVTQHYNEFKNYIKKNDTQHKLYDSKILQYNQ